MYYWYPKFFCKDESSYSILDELLHLSFSFLYFSIFPFFQCVLIEKTGVFKCIIVYVWYVSRKPYVISATNLDFFHISVKYIEITPSHSDTELFYPTRKNQNCISGTVYIYHAFKILALFYIQIWNKMASKILYILLLLQVFLKVQAFDGKCWKTRT